MRQHLRNFDSLNPTSPFFHWRFTEEYSIDGTTEALINELNEVGDDEMEWLSHELVFDMFQTDNTDLLWESFGEEFRAIFSGKMLFMKMFVEDERFFNELELIEKFTNEMFGVSYEKNWWLKAAHYDSRPEWNDATKTDLSLLVVHRDKRWGYGAMFEEVIILSEFFEDFNRGDPYAIENFKFFKQLHLTNLHLKTVSDGFLNILIMLSLVKTEKQLKTADFWITSSSMAQSPHLLSLCSRR